MSSSYQDLWLRCTVDVSPAKVRGVKLGRQSGRDPSAHKRQSRVGTDLKPPFESAGCGRRQPVIRHFYLSSEHDQIPDGVIECWATCYWCLQVCLTAPLSAGEQRRVRHHLRPVAEIAYRLTLPTQDELLGNHVIRVMDAMNESYAERLGVQPVAIMSAHRAQVEALFEKKPADNRQSAGLSVAS